MLDRGDVVARCKKCGKLIKRPSTRAGVLFECGACKHVQRSPGIALQEQATSAQLDFIERATKRHCLALIIALSIISLYIVGVSVVCVGMCCPAVLDHKIILWLISFAYNMILPMNFVAFCASVFLFFAEAKLLECLGRDKGMSLALFLVLTPVWLIRTVMINFKMRAATRRLKAAGVRA